MSDSKTVTIELYVKDPDELGHAIAILGLTEAKSRKFFEFGEYASLEIERSEDMTFTGRVLPVRRKS